MSRHGVYDPVYGFLPDEDMPTRKKKGGKAMPERRPDPAVALLRSVRDYKSERKMLEHRLSLLRAEAEHITVRYGGQPGGGGDPHKDALLAELADRSAALDTAIRHCWKREDAVDDFIHALPDHRHRAVLRLRYVDCLSWTRVAEGLRAVGIFYEPRQIFRLHGAALQAARNAYPGWARKHPEIRKELIP